MSWNAWGERLKAHMETQGISQEKAAEAMDLSQGGVSHWLSGRREINLSDFFRLCKVVGADPRQILFGDELDVQLEDAIGDVLAQSPGLLRRLAQRAANEPPVPYKRAAARSVKRKSRHEK